MAEEASRRRRLLRVTPAALVSVQCDPAAHADPRRRGGYLVPRPGDVPEIVLDGLAAEEEQQAAERRLLGEVLAQRDQAKATRTDGMLGNRLVAAGLLDAATLERTLERQRTLPPDRPVRRLGSLLVEAGAVSLRQVSEMLGKQRGVVACSCSAARVEPALHPLFPKRMLQELQAAPLSIIGRTLAIAMADPHDEKRLHALGRATHYPLRPMQAPQLHIQRLLESILAEAPVGAAGAAGMGSTPVPRRTPL